jgi:hypothetical protein
MAKITRIRLLAVKTEAAVGVPETPVGADATLKVFGPEMTPDDNTNEREYPAAMGSDKSEPGAKGGRLTFECEITGGATVPLWASELLPACDFAITGSTYTFSHTTTTKTFVLYEDGLKRTLYGARGTCSFSMSTGQIPRVRFEFMGKYKDEADATILAPTFDTSLAPMFGGGTNTVSIGSFAPNLSTLTIDVGNVVVLRESPNDPGGDSSGLYAAEITSRKTIGTMDPEASVVATRSWDSIRAARTEETLTVNLGTASGTNRVTISSAHFQTVKRPTGDRNGLLTRNIAFQLNEPAPLSVSFPDVP